MNLNELRDKAYRIARENGWHDKEYSNEHFLMLIITEIAEAVNADRSNRRAQRRIFEENANTPQHYHEKHWKFCYEHFIKGSLEEELADVVIRCLDLAGLKDCDLENFDYEASDNADYSDLPFTEAMFGIVNSVTDGWNDDDMIEDKIHDILNEVLALCKDRGVDLPWYIEQKMKYNTLRGYHHGGKKY